MYQCVKNNVIFWSEIKSKEGGLNSFHSALSVSNFSVLLYFCSKCTLLFGFCFTSTVSVPSYFSCAALLQSVFLAAGDVIRFYSMRSLLLELFFTSARSVIRYLICASFLQAVLIAT